jgi:hypothetical protein
LTICKGYEMRHFQRILKYHQQYDIMQEAPKSNIEKAKIEKKMWDSKIPPNRRSYIITKKNNFNIKTSIMLS